jgi:hypothetical protein
MGHWKSSRLSPGGFAKIFCLRNFGGTAVARRIFAAALS